MAAPAEVMSAIVLIRLQQEPITPEVQLLFGGIQEGLACVASVIVDFSAHSSQFSLFGRAKIGASTKSGRSGEGEGSFPSPFLHIFGARPNFRAAKSRKRKNRS